MRSNLLFPILGLLACILPAHRSLGQSPETSGIHPDRFVDRLPTIRSRMATARDYVRFADHFSAMTDRKEAIDLTLRTFQDIRLSGDIVAENIFVDKMTGLVPADTTLIPLARSLMDRLVTDNDSLLPKMTDKEEQRGVINQMAEGASIYLYALRPDMSIRYETEAIRLNQRLHQHATFPYQMLSWFYVTQGRLKDGLAVALDAMHVAETPAGLVDAAGYESLARVYFMTGDFDKCAEFSKKAFALFVKDPSKVEFSGPLLFRYVQILLQQKRAAEALHFIRSLMDPPSTLHADEGDRATWALSRAECFRALGQIDSADHYYKLAFALYIPLPPSRSFFRITPDLCLATFYVEQRRYIPAGRLLDTLLGPDMRGIIPAVSLEQTLFLRYEVDSALGNYPRAMAALRRYQRLHDSLTNYRLNKQLADLNIRSETEKTAQHITDLEKQSALQTQLHQTTVRQDRIVRNSLIAGAMILAIFATILYSRWRTRHRMALSLEKLSTRQQKLLGEKEWLLREIHHRVKNNLQIIISLLTIQADQLKDEIVTSVFEEVGARVNTISLVHKKLYDQTEDMAAIDMRHYIRELVMFLQDAFDIRQRIRFHLDIQEIFLDPSQCLPLGLILNEAITNVIKYAFPSGTAHSSPAAGINSSPPTTYISLTKEPGHHITLVVADNGIGLPAGFDPTLTSSLGLELIQMLTQQLNGTLEVTGTPGLTLTIRFFWIEPMTAAPAGHHPKNPSFRHRLP